MMVSSESQKHTRYEVIQIRHNMEQYMIAVTEEGAEATNLEGKFGIYMFFELLKSIRR
jgi:hypothetical protein